jgi:hypothetical protein
MLDTDTGAKSHRRVAGVDCRSARASTAVTGSGAPEWLTHEWKRRVEAETRHQLKRRISDVGSVR